MEKEHFIVSKTYLDGGEGNCKDVDVQLGQICLPVRNMTEGRCIA